MSVVTSTQFRGQCALAAKPGARAANKLAAPAYRLAPIQQQHCNSAPAARSSAASNLQRRASRQAGPAVRAAAAAADTAPQRQVQVSHILLADDQEAMAEQLRQRIQGGEALAALAAEHSSCSSASAGGSIGWVSRGQTVPEFDEAAFTSPVGAVAVVKTQYGVHVLQVTAEREAAEAQDMLVQELALSLQERTEGGKQDVQYVDVREEAEAEIAKLPHFQLFPLSKFAEWGPKLATGELLDRERQTIVLCQNGIKSLQFSKWLVSQGFADVRSVTGGITAYSLAVDDKIPMY